MRIKRILSVIAIVLTLTVALAVGFATPAHAASAQAKTPSIQQTSCGPSSYGYQCDNTDPFQTNCAANSARTSSYVYAWNQGSWWLAQEWYSFSCHTIWTRLWLQSGSNVCANCYIQITRYHNSSTWLNEGGPGWTLYSGAWTNQLYIVCGDVSNANFNGNFTPNWYGC